MLRLSPTVTVLGILTLLLAAGPAAAFTVEIIAPDQWGEPDEVLGLSAGVVEDFEDYQLAPGLQIEISDAQGQFSGEGWTVLPNLFDPVAGDPYGDSFASGVWDGTHVLVNTVDNLSQFYGSSDWRPVAIRVPGGADWIAVATQQVTINHNLTVNGENLGRLESLGFTLGTGPNGVLIVRSDDPETPITSISFGGRGDAFVIDHVVFSPADGNVATEAETWDAVRAMYRQ